MVRSIKRLKKGRPGTTTSEKDDNPITDCNAFKVIFSLSNKTKQVTASEP